MFKNLTIFVLIIYSGICLVSSQLIFNITANYDESYILSNFGKHMSDIMNQSVDPCNDFFKYSCGNFKDYALSLSDTGFVTSRYAITVQMEEEIKFFLKSSLSGEDSSSEKKIKKFYSSCIAMDNSKTGFINIVETIKEIILKNSNKMTDWIEINLYSNLGTYPLLPVDGFLNQRNVYEVFIFPQRRVLIDSDFEKFANEINLKTQRIYYQLKNEIESVKEFDEILTSPVKEGNLTAPLPLKKFLVAHKDDKIDWKRYFDVAFEGHINDTWEIYNEGVNINELAELLQNTDKDTLLLYVK